MTAPSRGKRALSIAGAGDNALALLLHFDQVLAIDLNPSQIALIELKKASFKVHGFFQHAELMGYCSSEQRPALYDSLTSLLSPETRRFWDDNQEIRLRGIAQAGRLEQYFARFRWDAVRMLCIISIIPGL